MTGPRDTADHDMPAAETRPVSLWPDTLQGAGPRSSQFSRFDPLADERRLRQRQSSHFDLCRPGLALRCVLSVQAGVAVAWAAASPTPAAWWGQWPVAAFVALAATLLWLPAVCVLRGWLPHRAPPLRWLAAGGLGAGAALVGWAMVLPLQLAAPGAWRALAVALSGGAMAVVLWGWLSLRARAAEPADHGARLAELQSRIRPHFLFNALNTALALVRADPPRAERVLEDLSELFRVALAEAGSAVTLDQEIDLARRYLAIEQVRFGSRLELSWELDPAAAAARVPPLMLQPLVENAVRHGIEPSLHGGRVLVHTLARRGAATIWVTNTVPLDAPPAPGAGIALANVRERLRLLHDLAATLEVWRETGLFHVRITVPL